MHQPLVATVFPGLTLASYRTIVIDPPWSFSAGTKGRPQHYARMSDDEIAALPIRALAHPDGCNVFLWVTSPKLPHALGVAKAWGARYSGRGFVWVKTTSRTAEDLLFLPTDALHVGTGFTTRKNAEDCLWFKFGHPRRIAMDVREVIVAPRRQHSRKPNEAYRRIERLSLGPRVELFSRETRPGFESWGHETGKFDRSAA